MSPSSLGGFPTRLPGGCPAPLLTPASADSVLGALPLPSCPLRVGAPRLSPWGPLSHVPSLRPRASQSIVNRVSSLAPPPGPLKPVTNLLSSIFPGGSSTQASEPDTPPGAPSLLPTAAPPIPVTCRGCTLPALRGSWLCPFPQVWTQPTCQLPLPNHGPPVLPAVVRPGWLLDVGPLLLSLGPAVPSNRASGSILANSHQILSHLHLGPPARPPPSESFLCPPGWPAAPRRL